MKLLILLLPALFLTVNGCLRIRRPVKCSPTDPSTFLLAYSNDLDYSHVKGIYRGWGEQFSVSIIEYAVAATVRFDTKIREDVVFHDSDTFGHSEITAYAYMNEQQVDPSQRFDSSETGSDVLDMLERYIDTNRPNICGSVALILMKRSPNEVEISKLVEKIRAYHILLTIAVQNPFSGGLHPETMYNLAARTNGKCSISTYLSDAFSVLANIIFPYAYHSSSLKVSGTGKVVLPSITIPQQMMFILGVSVQSTVTSESFQNLTLSWSNSEFGTSGSFIRNRGQLSSTYSSMNSFMDWDFLYNAAPSTYDLTLDYSYSMEDIILIRMYSKRPIDHWLPYQDV
ncbi:hypothetical protein L5515_002477 [Caenorhabditis briggsae]|uniref:DUF7154 domain-containing protein n=1 Tax=Caenorhabditis briggsae TaxID=6238 RepID=A0AAE9J5Q9_CAEBR|nr:hypothetical protein L5515_002477 [Caenorhabditis briggsae]